MFHEHPEYINQKSLLAEYRCLYAGGEEFRKNASSFLTRRQKEPLQVYGERLDRVFYENYIGSIIDWYAATLFRREPQIVVDGNSKAGRRYFSGLLDDCDTHGSNLTEFFRQQLISSLIYGKSYTLVDFPRVEQEIRTRADEEECGASHGYFQSFTPLDLINWSRDERGVLEWIVLRTHRQYQKSAYDSTWIDETQWTYYDKTQFRIYRQNDLEKNPELISEGTHGLARLNRVPLFELNLSDGLWLMRKAAQIQIEHLNKSNALSWALTMGLFAMPVVYSDREFKQIIGESYYIQLGPEDKFGWTEPEGHVYQLASDNLKRLQQEIYRVCYLLTQAGGSLTSGVSQSGLSKQRDFAITQEVLRGLGDRVKDVMKTVLRTLESVRGDDLLIDVTGLDEFDVGDFSSELEDGERLLRLGIHSPTFQKQLQKKMALKYLSDIRPDLKDKIIQEIEGFIE